MSDPFVHLHVASGYSLRYGASLPDRLVERAADHDMDTLALTDRDGVYGAVKFVKACLEHGVRPVLGVDLPVRAEEPGLDHRARRRARTPVRGGPVVDPRHSRVTVLAQGRAGWAALCRLVSATHFGGERGAPVSTRGLVAEHAASGDLVVLLGADSDVARAVARRRADQARAALRRWQSVVGTGDLYVEVVSHRAPGAGPGSTIAAARLLALADEAGVPTVLTNAVRYADPGDAPVVDVLDASRRLVALDPRHVDRVNAEGSLKHGKEMAEVAEDVARAAGAAGGRAARLLATTRALAERCVLDPRADLGLGEVHFPELAVSLGRRPDAGVADVGGPAGRPGDGGLAASGAGEAGGDLLARASAELAQRCEAGLARRYGSAPPAGARQRLAEELRLVDRLGYPSYFLTVAQVCDLVVGMGVRIAARGSGAGSLVCYLLGISGVDPLRHGLLMERFLSGLRAALPDVDIDVESARRTEVYQAILDRFGTDRVACVSMMDTYRVRHAIRDVGAALGLPPGEVDTIAKAFPHIRARDVRAALVELPELRASGIAQPHLDVLFDLVERLDGLPRHIALHPCGVLLSDATLLDRTPVEQSFLGFPMSQFDKDDVEDLGMLKLDVLGIRMQSAMAHAVDEVQRLEGATIDLDDQTCVPLDDPATFRLIQSTRTLGCFQIESPGQRELVGKFAPRTFDDLIIDISLFRPGPVKSDMVTPFLEARHGWSPTSSLHASLDRILESTSGVVVFHEQVIEIISQLTGCQLDEADEARRALGDPEGKEEVRAWLPGQALARGYDLATIERVWEVLEAFASFGFCKAHAAAFALPTYQSAWLKAHHPAAFLAGVLTHDPGMYPKRLILDDARNFGVAVLGLDVNASAAVYRVERIDPAALPRGVLGPVDGTGSADGGGPSEAPRPAAAGDGSGPGARRPAYGIRLALADVKGIAEAEVARVVAGQPYASLTDFWHRAGMARPVVERLVVAGAFDSLYGIGAAVPVRRRRGVTRRDLLLQLADLDRWSRAVARTGRGAGGRHRTGTARAAGPPAAGSRPADLRRLDPVVQPSAQLALDLGDAPTALEGSGLPEMDGAERVRAELEVLGLDASQHVMAFYREFLDAVGVTRSRDVIRQRSRSELLVAGVKVATQTPPIRSGRRVVFLTLDDSTGPVDATFFEDAQGPYAATLFHSWLLVVRGVLRRTGPRGVSLRATGCWELTGMHDAWRTGGLPAVAAVMDDVGTLADVIADAALADAAVAGAAESRSSRPVVAKPPVAELGGRGGLAGASPGAGPTAGGMGRRRVLVHPSGFRQSPYADLKPPGEDVRSGIRKLWHASPGSSGR